MLNVDWRIKPIREIPKTTQSAIGPAESQVQVDPEKVNTIMNKLNVVAFSTAPSQSIVANF
jgi:hypothetical protein